MKDFDRCYFQCPEEGTIHIGVYGGDSRWICSRHLEKWDAARDRFLADGGGCKMQRLGELLCAECTAIELLRGRPRHRLRVRQRYRRNLRGSHQFRLLFSYDIWQCVFGNLVRVRGMASFELVACMVCGDRAVPLSGARAPLPGSAQSGRHHENP